MNKNYINSIKAILYSTPILTLLTFASCGSSSDKSNDKQENTTPKEFTNSIQQAFIKKKSDLYYHSVIKPTNSAATTMFKEKTEQLTKDFLKENKNILTDWTGTVISVMLIDENGKFIMQDADNTKKIKIISLVLSAGTIKFDGGEDNYALRLDQSPSKKQGTKGIYPTNPLYDKVINLKEGEKIKFSAKVLKSDEGRIGRPSGKDYRKYENQATGMDVEFTAIEVLPTTQPE